MSASARTGQGSGEEGAQQRESRLSQEAVEAVLASLEKSADAVVQHTQTNIFDVYTFGRDLGFGVTSLVVEAEHVDTGAQRAVKIMQHGELDSKQRERLDREIDIHGASNHPNIVKLHEIYWTPSRVYMVLEYCDDGELFDLISSRGSLSETEARSFMRQLVGAVSYLHENDIAHRDIKPENILLTNHRTVLKLGDFGFAKREIPDTPPPVFTSLRQSAVGSLGYAAPEVRSQNYTKSVDMWSVGVILYTMLVGFPPWHSEDLDELESLIVNKEVEFPSPWWDQISSQAQQLIASCLLKDASKRCSADEFLAHPWMLEAEDDNSSAGSGSDEEGQQHSARSPTSDSHFKASLNRSIDGLRSLSLEK